MLVVDSKKRLSAIDALHHEWFISSKATDTPIDPSILINLQKFRGVSKLKKAAMNMLVKMADQKAIMQLRQEFQKLDQDQTGLINVSELKSAMKQS